MNNFTKKLTIAIPTFARPDLLKETLMKILPQAIDQNVAICISDNSEDDNTCKMISELLKSYDFIKYHKNMTNIGFDRNICNAVSMAETEYVWLFGDDDWPTERALEFICKKIAEFSPDLMLVNAISMSPNMEYVLTENISNINEDFSPCKSDLLFNMLAWYSTFIGAIVVKKEFWDSVDQEKYYSTGFVHVGIIYEALIKNKSEPFFFSNPIVYYRSNAASWSANFLPLIFHWWPLTIGLLPKSYSHKDKESAILSVPTRFARASALANLRKDNNLTHKNFKEFVFPFWTVRKKNGYAIKTVVLCVLLLTVSPSVIGKMLNLRKFLLRK